MRRQLLDAVAIADVEEEAVSTSPYTGRQLRAATVTIAGRGAAGHDHVEASLKERTWTDVDTGCVYTHTLRSSMTSDERWSFTVALTELEVVEATTVTIDGLQLAPLRYREDAAKGGLTVWLRAHVDAATRDALETMLETRSEYRDVVRVGVEDRVRRMRFGQCEWSRHDDVTKYTVVLVEDAYDTAQENEEPFRGFNYPGQRNAERAIVELQVLIERIGSTLVESGVIAADVWAELVDTAEAAVSEPRRRRQFLEVDDVDVEPWHAD